MLNMILLFIAVTLSLPGMAGMDFIRNNGLSDKSVENIKIVYTGFIAENQITDFLAALEEANNNYPNAKNIYLYINSRGGDMDSGYMAYEAIRSSHIPVTAVNASGVASAASLMFCGASKRLSMPHASFLLHPAALYVEGEIKPDELTRTIKELARYNALFKAVYEKCTSLSPEELTDILYSEKNSLLLSASEALSKGIITDTLNLQPRTQVSYYITGEESGISG